MLPFGVPELIVWYSEKASSHETLKCLLYKKDLMIRYVCWNSFQFVGPGVRVGIFFNEIDLEFIVRSIGEWSDARIFEFSIWDWI
ncbi:hypothetical protein QTP88_015368 [Uroleucon formosanum]